MIRRLLVVLLALVGVWGSPVEAGWTKKGDGKWMNSEYAATMPAQDHYSAGMQSLRDQAWNEAVHQFGIVTCNFPHSPFYADALFYFGVSLYQVGEYDIANKHLSGYLKEQATPKHLEEAIQYKFAIAEKFREGAKKHMFGSEKFPKWVGAKEDALVIYDEVVATLPNNDIAARALFSKGVMLMEMDEYQEAVDSYQLMIRRFPKHELTPQGYLAIGQIYLAQSYSEFHNPDLEDLARINLRRFRTAFPSDERVTQVEELLTQMNGEFAAGLLETARFYERTGRPRSAVIYYTQIVRQFPHTPAGDQSRTRLQELKKTVAEMDLVDQTAEP